MTFSEKELVYLQCNMNNNSTIIFKLNTTFWGAVNFVDFVFSCCNEFAPLIYFENPHAT